MHFTRPTCPRCSARAGSLLGHVLTTMALVDDSVIGPPGYDDDPRASSEIAWESEEPARSEAGECELTCSNGHQWRSKETDAPSGAEQSETIQLGDLP